MAVIEDFEDGSLPSHYVGNRGRVDVKSSSSWVGKTGTYYAQGTSSSEAVVTTDNVIISPGETPIEGSFHLYNSVGLVFGVEQTGGTSSFSGYVAYASSAYTILYRVDNGNKSVVALQSQGINFGTPITIRVTEWTVGGNITFEVINNSTGNTKVTLSGTDTTYGAGGYGFLLEKHYTSDTPRVDNIQANVALSTPQNATLESPSLGAIAQPLSATGGAEPAPAGDVTRGLVSKWTLDGNAVDAVGSNDGTTSGVSYTGGYIDQAGSFSPGSSYINCGSDPSLYSDSFTVSAWVYLDALGDGNSQIRTVAAKNSDHSNRMFWLVHWNGDWQVRVGSNAKTINGGLSETGKWTHLVVTYDGASNTFELWVDGVSKGTNTESSLGGQGTPFYIGCESDAYRMFDGLIDEVRFYSVVLTDSEISDLNAYDGTAVVLTATLDAATVGSLAPSLSVTPGSVSATLDGETANVAASELGSTPGPVSAGLGSYAAGTSASPVSATPGPASAGLGTVGVTAAAQPAGLSPGDVLAQLDSTGLGSTAFALSGSVGALSAMLESGSLSVGPVSVSAEPGPVSAGLDSYGISQAAFPFVTELAPVTIPLESVAVSGSVASISATPGSVSAGLDPMSVALLAHDISLSEAVVITLDSAGLASTPNAVRAVPGLTVAELASAGLDLIAEAPIVAAGEVAVGLDAGSVSLSAENVVPIPGAASAGLDSTSVVLTAPDVGVLRELFAALDSASLASGSESVGAVPGGVSAHLESVSGLLAANTVASESGPVNLELDVAELAAQVPGLTAENIKFLFLRVSKGGGKAFTLGRRGGNGFSVTSPGESGFSPDSGGDYDFTVDSPNENDLDLG